ncbi:DUF1806 family protein [Paenibacillus sp.]|uniref:DUF1806 family protein n=1 Tax=Paenibacillus sp. TaxID=58172 RepID=UPI002D6182B2|nr:DUF1806 family protein [Paenibacillus sp.]HZG56081.1 DUF1806 family protein [Paenibacillus sp.]
MRKIVNDALEESLRQYEGRKAFVHMEVTPGGFVRNAEVSVLRTYVAGSGTFRVALRLANDGWIRVEGLTHMALDERGSLLLAGHDEKGRLTSALQLGFGPFPA